MPILMPMLMLSIVHSYEVYLQYRTCMHDSVVIAVPACMLV